MTTDTRTPEEIERDIGRERAGLTDTIEDLQDRFSVEGVTRQVTDHLRENGGDIGRAVSRSVKDNPMAIALTGIGIAWMIFGNSGGSRSRSRWSDDDYDDYDDDDRYAYRGRASASRRARFLSRDYDDYEPSYRRGGPDWLYDDPSEAGGYDRSTTMSSYRGPSGTGAHLSTGTLDNGSDGPSMTDKAKAAGQSVADRASAAGSAVAGKASAAGSAVGDKASAAGSAISDRASAAGSAVGDTARSAQQGAASAMSSARDGASQMADRAAARAAMMRERLARGTEELSEEARNRVIAARVRAWEARQAAERYALKGQRQAADMFDDQPVIGGVLAFAVGAAIAAAIPRTRMEDDALGTQSDQAIAEAERIFHEEKQKLGAVATAAGEEAKKAAEDVKKSVDSKASSETAAKSAADTAKSAGQRVADAAKREAEKQDLGKSVT